MVVYYKSLHDLNQLGQAMAEMTMSLTVLGLVMLPAIVMFGQYADIRSSAIQANRYTAWENAIGKPLAEVDPEVKNRFFGHPLDGISVNMASTNPVWKSIAKTDNVEGLNSNSSLIAEESPILGLHDQSIVVENDAYTRPSRVVLESFKVKNPIGLPGSDISNVPLETSVRLGVKEDGALITQVNVPMKNIGMFDNDSGVRPPLYIFRGGMAVGDDWAPASNEEYFIRVSNLVPFDSFYLPANQTILAMPGMTDETMNNDTLFQDLNSADEGRYLTVPKSQTTIVPPNKIRAP